MKGIFLRFSLLDKNRFIFGIISRITENNQQLQLDSELKKSDFTRFLNSSPPGKLYSQFPNFLHGQRCKKELMLFSATITHKSLGLLFNTQGKKLAFFSGSNRADEGQTDTLRRWTTKRVFLSGDAPSTVSASPPDAWRWLVRAGMRSGGKMPIQFCSFFPV